MIISNPSTANYLIAATGELLRCTILDIGDWDMNVSAAGSQIKDVAHGLDMDRIKSVTGYIQNDANTIHTPISLTNGVWDPGPGFMLSNIDVAIYEINAINIRMRHGGGASIFSNVNYDDTPYNRGKLFIIYED